MATYSVSNAAPTGYAQGTMFAAGANLAGATGTELLYINPDGSRVVIQGSGFVFSGSVALGGVIDSVQHFDSSQTTLFASYTSAGIPVLDLYSRWFGPSSFPELAMTAGADFMVGSVNADSFGASGGNDTINGGDGDDYIDPGDGADIINGGNGLDTLSYSAANADAAITKGITVNLNFSTFLDPWGNTETISSIEHIRSTRFADTLTGNASANRFEGLAGADSFVGGDGFDWVNYQRDARYGGTKGVTVNLATGLATDGFGDQDSFTGIEGAGGTDQADFILGGDKALSGFSYETYGYAGDDTIKAGSFDMYIEPGAGNDTITGGASASDQVSYQEYTGTKGAIMNLATGIVNDPYGGTDTITGGIEGLRGTRNADTLIGDAKNNFLRGLAGNDTLDGGAGRDFARYDRDATRGGTKGVVADLGTGTATDGFGDTDTLISIEHLAGTNSADMLTAGDTPLEFRFFYSLIGLGGDDTLKARSQGIYAEPGAGNDTVIGGPAFDQISYSDYTGSVGLVLDFSLGKVSDPFGGIDTFTSIESVRATRNADTLTGDGQDNQFQGLAGQDMIIGGAGIDEVRYDADASYGGKNTVFVDLQRGLAFDAFGFSFPSAGTLSGIEGIGRFPNVDTLSGIEGIRGTNALEFQYVGLDGMVNHADVLYGNGADNFFRGLRGKDLIDGRGGSDTVDYSRDAGQGGLAGAVVDLVAKTGVDGFGTVDTLLNIENVTGTDFDDTIRGDSGANVLTGGLGDDILYGAGGTDIVVFSGASASYTVTAGPNGMLFVSGADGKDTLRDIEVLRFSDTPMNVDAASSFSINTVTELLLEGGGEGSTIFSFNVTRGGGTTQAHSIGWSVVEGIRTGGPVPAQASDFPGGVFPSGTVSFAAGETEKTITVPVERDAVSELSERFMVTLGTPPAGASVGAGSAEALILNDDAIYEVTSGVGALSEGTGGTRAFTLTVQRGYTYTVGNGTVDFAVQGIGAAPASADDFVGGVLPTGIVSFSGDDLSKTVIVYVVADAAPEANESFQIVLSNPTGGSIFGGTASAIIIDDDSTLSIAATSANKPEGTGLPGATTPFTFTVTRAGGTNTAQSVNWSVAGTAGAGTLPADAADFAGGGLPFGTLSFGMGEASRIITIPVAADALNETDDRFVVMLSGPTNGATLVTASAQGIIQSDDATYSVSGGAAVSEGTGGTRVFTFNVARSGATGGTGTVAFAVTGSGASPASGADFAGGVLPSGTLSFAANETSRTVSISVVSDAAVEANEGFQINLSAPTGGDIATASATATILNDDTAFSIAAASTNKPEGTGAAGATTAFTFTVTRAGTPGVAQNVAWSVAGIAGAGTSPAAAADFAGGAFPSGTLSFAAGETSRTLTVRVAADAAVETAERFAVTLANPTGGAVLGTASAQGIIQNDDASLRVVAGGAMAQAEGNAGVRAYSFQVQRQGNVSGTCTVQYSVAGSGAAPATASDFAGGVLPSGAVTFLAGETSKTVTVNVAGDTAQEADEGFQLVLSGATGASIAGASLGAVIQSDDSTLSIAAASASKPEGNGPAGATTQFTFTVTRTGATGLSQGVSFAVAGASGSGTAPATAPDFATGVFPTGNLGFAAGQTTRTITINVRADQAQELNERFAVTLANPTGGAQIGTGTAQGIIFNDDFVSTAANQTLTGGAAPDLFLLGGGLDTVTGNGGQDSFRFLQAAIGTGAVNATTIQDFNPGIGEKLDLSAIDAIAGTLANDAFIFNPVAGAGFSGAGSLVWQADGTRVAILGDTNGDFTADLTIFVRPVGTPDASWFIL